MGCRKMRTDTNRARDARIRRNRRIDLARVSKPKRRRMPRWVPVASSLTLVVMIVATVNFRAYSELKQEEKENQELNQQVQRVSDENLGIQEEIYYLKNDNETIEREAKKYGLVRPQTKNSRAGEMEKAEESTNRQTPTRK